MQLLKQQSAAWQEKRAYTLATIVETQGETPRSVGSKMMVLEDGTICGTIGGGVLEGQVQADALDCLKTGSPILKHYENRSVTGISPCGGRITVFLEPCLPRPQLVVVGAGHVGAALIRLSSQFDYSVTAVDTRDTDITRENVKCADAFYLTKDFSEDLLRLPLPEHAFYLVSTYGHEEDCEALASVLQKNPQYVGMMGSPVKIRSIFHRLKERGFSEEQLHFVHTPVGLDIGGETPMEIALSILSEIQMVRYRKTGASLSTGREE